MLANEQARELLKQVLYWTGGQPFFTQKICKLILTESEDIEIGQEAKWLDNLVQKRVIENWEAQDEPEHLRTIRDRLVVNEKKASVLLALYKTIVTSSQSKSNSRPVESNKSTETMQLRLTGLIVEKQNQLIISNPIYEAVFNKDWVEGELNKIRPYPEAFQKWVNSGKKEKYLLHNKEELDKAKEWKNKNNNNLSDLDRDFINKSIEHSVEKKLIRANSIIKFTYFTIPLMLLALIGFSPFWIDRFINQEKAVNTPSEILPEIKEIESWSNPDAGSVNAVAFSPDGKKIAAGYSNGTIKLFQRDGTLIKNISRNGIWIHSLVFSPNGKILAVGTSQGTIELWNEDGTLNKTIKIQDSLKGTDLQANNVYSLAFSGNGEHIVSGSEDGIIQHTNLDYLLTEGCSRLKNSGYIHDDKKQQQKVEQRCRRYRNI